jgi:hypothetical protein
VAEAQHTYALGRDCTISVNGTVLSSAGDVFIRETVVTIGATVRNSAVAVAIPIQRSLEIDFSLADARDIKFLGGLRTVPVPGAQQPNVSTIQSNVVSVSLAGGVFDGTGRFTVHDVVGDEPLNGAVLARVSLRQWVGMEAGKVGTAGNATPPAE